MAHTTCRVELPAACVSRGIWGRTPDSNGWNDVGSTPTPPFFSFPCGTFFSLRMREYSHLEAFLCAYV